MSDVVVGLDPRIATVVPSPQPPRGLQSQELRIYLDSLEQSNAKLRAELARSLQIIAVRLEALEAEGAADE